MRGGHGAERADLVVCGCAILDALLLESKTPDVQAEYEGYTERAKQRFVRLTRRFDGVMSTVMVPTDYPVQPGDTIYVLERFF